MNIYIIKKSMKYIIWSFSGIIIFFIMTLIIAHGGLGDKMQYYFWKGLYYINNPKNEPAGEIVIDLKNTNAFIEENSKPNMLMHPYIWRTMEESGSKIGHIGLQSYLPLNPFAYLKLKIILNDATLIIPNFLLLYIDFKDYYHSEDRIKNPKITGLQSLKLYCLEGQPAIVNGAVLQRRTDYDFAYKQHQILTFLFNELGFYRDIHADEIEKNKRNEQNKSGNSYSNSNYLEYKTWVKDNFEFTLILKFNKNEYTNCIYITPKDII